MAAMVLGTSATALAGTSNVCQVTSQDGLNACKNGAQGDYWTAVGMCANISDSQSRQACILKAKSDYQSAITTCQDQFTSRNQICRKLGGGPYDPTIDPANFSTNIENPYMPLKPGTTYIYEGPTSQGFIRTRFAVTTNTKLIEVHDHVFTMANLPKTRSILLRGVSTGNNNSSSRVRAIGVPTVVPETTSPNR
jgi:hypothetical protein